MTDFPKQILFVGCGNMAGAMLRGWIADGLDPARVTIVDPGARNLPDGVDHRPEMSADIPAPDLVLLGIKPQMLADIAPSLTKVDMSKAILLSILAGVECRALRKAVPGVATVVRVMPNMAVSIAKSVLALYSEEADDPQREKLTGFFSALGLVEWLPEEQQMHAFTALAGSGPAYVFRFIDALGEGARALGMDADQANRFALAMVEGAAMLAAGADDTPGELADKVASPGGTTRAGLNVLDEDKAIFVLAERTLAAAASRSREMAKELDV